MAKKQSIPGPALWLGLGGVLPFLACTAGMIAGSGVVESMAKIGLIGYGAVILSFLGGIRWGALLTDRARLKKWSPLLLSVLPSLVGWLALLVNLLFGLLILIVGFGFQYYLDRQAQGEGIYPQWFSRLRTWLTVLVLLCLLVALGITLIQFRL
ncbi:MAG: DUF3429 domain-containing protein [Gammaproteobacteria bacterium]|nr:DUF3429 domain-containing protein [Gammaproteobacteria bacterium]